MFIAFKKHIETHFSQLYTTTSLLAISGGVDSVVLGYMLQELGIKISLIHCNFKLRAQESDQDEQFIKSLAQQWDCKLYTTTFDTEQIATDRGISIQMAARDLRYEYFEQIRNTHGYQHIMTAHHLDDQIGTFFINLNRGAGLQGMQGIPQQNGAIIRPLLPFTRNQILGYAQEYNIDWREDSSNQVNKYQRNQLRNEVLPRLQDALPHFKDHFLQTLDYLNDAQMLVDDAVLRFRESAITTTTTGIKIHIDTLQNTSNPRAYLYQIIKDYGFVNMSDAMDVMIGLSGKYIISSTHMMVKERDFLTIKLLSENKVFYEEIDNLPYQLTLPQGTVKLEAVTVDRPLEYIKKNLSNEVLYLDAEKLTFPLVVRSWEIGDRIQPYGMKGSKLVSNLLTDCKVSFTAKEKIVVLTSNEEILWVVGVRTSKYFPITATTNKIIKVTYTL